MSDTKKKRFFLSHKKSSALVVSIAMHAVFVVVALTFVAVKVYIKPEQTFEVKDVQRPQMKLRKLQVPVKEQKKTQAPKLRHTIVTKPKYKDVNIKMPEVVGVPGGTGYGRGEGLGGLGFGFELDLFGSSRGTGNEFIGTFYDLKQTPDGKLTDIGENAKDPFNRGHQLAACKVIKNFIASGCNPGRLKDYFQAPKLKYATSFMMPPMPADAAPKAFGVDDQVKPSYWLCHYKGQIVAPETGRYRFCGIGDDILVVRLGRRVVLDACWPELIGQVTSWETNDENNRKFSIDSKQYGKFQRNEWEQIYDQLDRLGLYKGNIIYGDAIRRVNVNGNSEYYHKDPYMKAACRMVLGDWVPLKKGQAVDVDIVISEIPGGDFCARLLIEQEGKNDYQIVDSDAGPRKVLPIFKTVPIDEKLIPQMNIDPNDATPEGPSFGVLLNSPKKPGL